MIDRYYAEFWLAMIQISIDICNLIEQIIIYLIVKEENIDDVFEERLFFFVLVIIGLLSNIPSVSPYLYFQTMGSIAIEFGELMAYLFLLKHSINVILVAFISFLIEFTLHLMQIFLEYNSVKFKDDPYIFGKSTCGRVKYVVLRLISYCVFDATSISFLFLEKNSRFHNRFYEILILLTFYFPSIALGPAIESINKYTNEFDQGQIPQVTILLIWSLFCATIYFIMYSIPLAITGTVFAIQELREISLPYGYDYVVYIGSLIFFLTAILVFPPFMVWWWKFTYRRFKKMRTQAKQRLHQSKQDDSIDLYLKMIPRNQSTPSELNGSNQSSISKENGMTLSSRIDNIQM